MTKSDTIPKSEIRKVLLPITRNTRKGKGLPYYDCQGSKGGSALRKLIGRDNLGAMKLEEIEREAIALAERDRVDLVCKLLDTLPPPGTDVSDQEVARRESELDKGEVEELSHDEFERRVEKERGK